MNYIIAEGSTLGTQRAAHAFASWYGLSNIPFSFMYADAVEKLGNVSSRAASVLRSNPLLRGQVYSTLRQVLYGPMVSRMYPQFADMVSSLAGSNVLFAHDAPLMIANKHGLLEKIDASYHINDALPKTMDYAGFGINKVFLPNPDYISGSMPLKDHFSCEVMPFFMPDPLHLQRRHDFRKIDELISLESNKDMPIVLSVVFGGNGVGEQELNEFMTGITPYIGNPLKLIFHASTSHSSEMIRFMLPEGVYDSGADYIRTDSPVYIIERDDHPGTPKEKYANDSRFIAAQDNALCDTHMIFSFYASEMLFVAENANIPIYVASERGYYERHNLNSALGKGKARKIRSVGQFYDELRSDLAYNSVSAMIDKDPGVMQENRIYGLVAEYLSGIRNS